MTDLPRSSLALSPRPVRIETLPLIIGVLVAMLGIGIMFDAWTPDQMIASQERRRRPRIERHRNGEAMIGLGVLALGAALIGRDSWRYSILVVIIGALFLVVGAVLNGRYVRELFVNRGPLRRRDVAEHQEPRPNATGVTEPAPFFSKFAPTSAHADASDGESWDGNERRKTPRERGSRKSPRRGPAPEDSAST